MLEPKKTTHFSVDYYQVMDASAQPTSPLPEFAQDLQHVQRLYHNMALLRAFDEKAIALQRTGNIGTYPASTGQEAIYIGVGDAMHSSDVLCPYYRDHGTLMQRGVSLAQILAYWGGDERANNFVNNREDFPIAVPIASQCLHATGVAYAFKCRKQPRAVVATIGDGATSKGDFYEALNVAGAWQLPIVFVINNNQWAISTNRTQQTATQTLAQKAIAAGIDGIQVDGNDIFAVRALVDSALISARTQSKPTVIEALTYRLCDHTTADDARRYADPQLSASAKTEEPIGRLYRYLMQQGAWSQEQQSHMMQQIERTIKDAVYEYLHTPPPSPDTLLDYLWAELPLSLSPQRDDLIDHAAHHPG